MLSVFAQRDFQFFFYLSILLKYCINSIYISNSHFFYKNIIYNIISESKRSIAFKLYGLKYPSCHIYCSVLCLLCFYDKVTNYQSFKFSFDLLT